MFVIYILFFGVSVTFQQVVEAVIYLNVKSLATISTLLKHLLREMVTYGLPYLLFYIIWTFAFDFNHPMPFIAFLGVMVSWGLQPFMFWFLLSSYLKEKKAFRKKVWFYILYQVAWMMIQVQLTTVNQIFRIRNYTGGIMFNLIVK